MKDIQKGLWRLGGLKLCGKSDYPLWPHPLFWPFHLFYRRPTSRFNLPSYIDHLYGALNGVWRPGKPYCTPFMPCPPAHPHIPLSFASGTLHMSSPPYTLPIAALWMFLYPWDEQSLQTLHLSSPPPSSAFFSVLEVLGRGLIYLCMYYHVYTTPSCLKVRYLTAFSCPWKYTVFYCKYILVWYLHRVRGLKNAL